MISLLPNHHFQVSGERRVVKSFAEIFFDFLMPIFSGQILWFSESRFLCCYTILYPHVLAFPSVSLSFPHFLMANFHEMVTVTDLFMSSSSWQLGSNWPAIEGILSTKKPHFWIPLRGLKMPGQETTWITGWDNQFHHSKNLTKKNWW